MLRAFAPRSGRMAPGALLVIAPRQPERFDEVERLARRRRASASRAASNLPIDGEPRADVVVLDTFGELAQVYQIATVVFVGGSLADYGGHNILEPAVFGKPIVFGPHMHNFREIAEAFLANGAAVQVQTERELEEALRDARSPIRFAAPASAPPRARWSTPTAAPRTRRWPSIPMLPAGTSPAAWSGRSDWFIDRGCAQRGLRRRGAPGGASGTRDAPSRTRAWRGPSSASATCASAAAARRRSSRCIARLLREQGERPGDPQPRLRAARSRATASRSCPTARAVLADVGACGRRTAACWRARYRGVPVLVCADRYHGGPRWPRAEFGATVHLLDDGFQHVQLGARRRPAAGATSRISTTACCRPAGCASRWQTPRRLHAVIVPPAPGQTRRATDCRALGVRDVFRAARALGTPLMLRPAAAAFDVPSRCSPSPASRGPNGSSTTCACGRLAVVGTHRVPRSPPVHRSGRRRGCCRRARGCGAQRNRRRPRRTRCGLRAATSAMPFAAVPLLTAHRARRCISLRGSLAAVGARACRWWSRTVMIASPRIRRRSRR